MMLPWQSRESSTNSRVGTSLFSVILHLTKRGGAVVSPPLSPCNRRPGWPSGLNCCHAIIALDRFPCQASQFEPRHDLLEFEDVAQK